MKKVGVIDLTKSKYVFVSDASYPKDCVLSQAIPIVSGKYNTFVMEEEIQTWGKLVTNLAILHEDYDDVTFDEECEYYGEVYVDSGTMSICDYEYYCKHHDPKNKKVVTKNNKWYEKYVVNLCQYAICDKKGIVSLSGFGDGQYGVYVYRNTNDEIIGIKVIFIENI